MYMEYVNEIAAIIKLGFYFLGGVLALYKGCSSLILSPTD